jgi:hypothetical protein
VTGYHPMTLADLAGRLARAADGKVRWKLVWEFLEEYRWEPEDVQPSLLHDEPSSLWRYVSGVHVHSDGQMTVRRS